MKRYEFELNDSLYEYALLPIRNKHDLLQLLARTIKELILTPVSISSQNNESRKLVVYVDKMSRLLFCVKDKIFTFQFPLQIRIDPESDNQITVLYAGYFEIDTIVSSLLIAIFSQEDIFTGSLDNINDKVLQEVFENEWEGIDWDDLCELIKDLMLFEPGYLRYDHDVEHANGALHPEHHLDFFFSSNSTMKLGLPGMVDSEWMLDMLNILTDCKFIK